MALYREGTRSISGISGPLLFVSNARKAALGELVAIETNRGRRTGQVLQIDGDICAVQVFEGTLGLNTGDCIVWFEKDVVKVRLGQVLVGQTLDGRGNPRGGKALPCFEKETPITGSPLNPAMRAGPNEYVETGIASIDLLNTIVRGQKLPLFSGSGLPANEIAAQVVKQAHVPGNPEQFLVVFAALGITEREARFFRDSFEESGPSSTASSSSTWRAIPPWKGSWHPGPP